MLINPVVVFILLGLVAITLVATLGAWVSRKFNFNYSRLTLISLSIYITIGYLVAKRAGLNAAILANAVMAFFDATVGWNLCLRFQAKLSLKEEESLNTPASIRVILMIVIGAACGYVGYLMADN